MSRISPHRVRIPTDRNVAAAARRCAIVPDELLMRQYRGRVPDLVQMVHTGVRESFRSFFALGEGRYACYLPSQYFTVGLRLT